LEGQESDLVRTGIMQAALNFLDYSTLDSKEFYTNELQLLFPKWKVNEKAIRELPHYPDVLMFQELLERFTNEWGELQKVQFFPILLWWKITNIIPLRPSEFCDIQRNPLSTHKKKYYLTVPRKKQKGSNKTVEIVDTLEINESLYELISEYIDLTDEYGESETLISYTSLVQTRNIMDHTNANMRYFHYQNLFDLLNKFYSEVIERKYGLQLDRIRLNDPRHFAFSNMMLQGFNALTIARMGGHRLIDSQYHYQQHMPYFVQSKVFYLSQQFKLQALDLTKGKASAMDLEQARINSLQPRSNFDFMEEVEIGNCTDKAKNCESDLCQFCSKWWIPNEEFHQHIEELRNIAETKLKKITDRINLMERIRRDMEINIKSKTHNPYDQEALSRESKLLNGDIQDLALLHSKMPNETFQ